jgi:hypothetical protein
MAEIKTPPVPATPVADITRARHIPGAFKFFCGDGTGPSGLNYVCPCGCGAIAPLHFKPEPSPSWTWNGNREKPTLTPSVHHVGHWHGYLTDGMWVSC